MNPFVANSIVWPLAFVLVALFVLRSLRERISPIADGVVSGISKHASQFALLYALAFLLAMNASLEKVVSTFGALTRDQLAGLAWWQVGALLAGCFTPAVSTLIALIIKSPLESKPPAKGDVVT